MISFKRVNIVSEWTLDAWTFVFFYNFSFVAVASCLAWFDTDTDSARGKLNFLDWKLKILDKGQLRSLIVDRLPIIYFRTRWKWRRHKFNTFPKPHTEAESELKPNQICVDSGNWQLEPLIVIGCEPNSEAYTLPRLMAESRDDGRDDGGGHQASSRLDTPLIETADT